MIVVFFVVSFLMYCLYNLIPSDPARNLLEGQKKNLKPSVYEQMYRELREEMGLDDPIFVRYARWMGIMPDRNGHWNGLIEGNFGQSLFFKDSVVNVIKEPIKITGYYKYSPGETFTDKDSKEVAGRIDEPSIYSVLYVNHDAQGNEVMLHGDDVLSSPYIVRKAQVASLPATSEWKKFEMSFEGEDVDTALLTNRGYNLALVFSSSKTGDTFEGSVGSTLYVDKVEITFIGE
jgi:hypothetical protein